MMYSLAEAQQLASAVPFKEERLVYFESPTSTNPIDRNEYKRRKAIQWLGTRHVLHSNSTFNPKHAPVLKK